TRRDLADGRGWRPDRRHPGRRGGETPFDRPLRFQLLLQAQHTSPLHNGAVERLRRDEVMNGHSRPIGAGWGGQPPGRGGERRRGRRGAGGGAGGGGGARGATRPAGAAGAAARFGTSAARLGVANPENARSRTGSMVWSARRPAAVMPAREAARSQRRPRAA